MNLHFRPYTLQLRNPFTLSTGSRTTTPAVLVELEARGITGYGEVSMPPYLGETVEGAVRFLASAQELLEDDSALLSGRLSLLNDILASVDRCAPGCHAAKAGVDIALHDWLGKALGRPCHELYGIAPGNLPPSSYTIGIGDPEFLGARVKEAEGFPVLKVKLGAGSDREIIGAVRAVTDRRLRVDVNQGWNNRDDAARMVEWLAGEGVELVEQPFPRERPEDTAWLRERSSIPLVADESVVRYADLSRAAGVFDGVNIKLMKCTGIAEAERMMREARRLGLRAMIGCMTETSCGISAAAQLAPLADWADLDGALLIANDPFTGAAVHAGTITLPDAPGIGVTWCGAGNL